MTNEGYFETVDEMQEALDQGYELENQYGEIMIKKYGDYLLFKGTSTALLGSLKDIAPYYWKIKLPDLTKPFASMLEYKGWEKIDGEWVECYFFSSIGKWIKVWDNGKKPKYHGYESMFVHTVHIDNFSWTDPRPKKRKVTLELTDDQIESLREQGVEV